MSYVRNDSLMYQMPVHFGPCVTPRQNKEGNRFIYDQATRLTKHTIVYESDPEALSAVLPQRFELAAPYVIINMNMLRDVAWLAGHGYNLTGVSVPTRFHGEKGVVEGNLLLVMWENHADPIITGREQLGYSKIFASIDDIHTYGGVSKTELTSWGFRFLELEFDANRQPENLEELKRVLNNPDSQGIMHYKYIPRTGGGFTQADAEYVCLNPKAAKLPDDVKKYPADQLTYMGGQVRWHIPTWEDMPTQYHVAQALGSLPVKRIVGVVRSEGYTLGDLYGQTTVM